MTAQRYLVFGATGQTGRRFLDVAFAHGHLVRAVARTPANLMPRAGLEVMAGSVTDDLDLDSLLAGIDAVVVMIGDRAAQAERLVNTEFIQRLVPAMRRAGVERLLYQAGGLSAPPRRRLNPILWMIRRTIARSYDGQHRDNEAVMRYLDTEARDLTWVVHRAGIGSDGESKGTLQRSAGRTSIATFRDCAEYSYRLLSDASAVHTYDTSVYRRR